MYTRRMVAHPAHAGGVLEIPVDVPLDQGTAFLRASAAGHFSPGGLCLRLLREEVLDRRRETEGEKVVEGRQAVKTEEEDRRSMSPRAREDEEEGDRGNDRVGALERSGRWRGLYPRDPVPELLLQPLAFVLLFLLTLGLSSLSALPFLTPPLPQSVLASLRYLRALEAIEFTQDAEDSHDEEEKEKEQEEEEKAEQEEDKRRRAEVGEEQDGEEEREERDSGGGEEEEEGSEEEEEEFGGGVYGQTSSRSPTRSGDARETGRLVAKEEQEEKGEEEEETERGGEAEEGQVREAKDEGMVRKRKRKRSLEFFPREGRRRRAGGGSGAWRLKKPLGSLMGELAVKPMVARLLFLSSKEVRRRQRRKRKEKEKEEKGSLVSVPR